MNRFIPSGSHELELLSLLLFCASPANQSLAWMRVARVWKSLTPWTS